MPVTPAAPGAWQIGSIGSNSPWAVPGTFSAHCPPLLLPLSWIKPLFPALHHLLLSLFCFTSPHSLLPIFPSRLPLKERDLNANRSRSPTLTTTTTPPRSIPPRFPPRSSSEAAKASITPSLATDDPGKIFLFFILEFAERVDHVVWACFITTLGFVSTRVATTGPTGQRVSKPNTLENGSFQSCDDLMTGSESTNPSLSLAENTSGRARQEQHPKLRGINNRNTNFSLHFATTAAILASSRTLFNNQSRTLSVFGLGFQRSYLRRRDFIRSPSALATFSLSRLSTTTVFNLEHRRICRVCKLC